MTCSCLTSCAFVTGSPYRSHLSYGILQLQESGALQSLKRRWWEDNAGRGCAKDEGHGSSSKVRSSANKLGLAKVGGVFVVLLVGLAIACVIAFTEFMFKARSMSRRKNPLELKLKWNKYKKRDFYRKKPR